MLLFEERPLILVVDDESMVLSLVSTILTKHGYQVHSAADGQEATELFEKQPRSVAMLLTDLTMPRKSGIQLIREIRILRPELPVVAMTGDRLAWKDELAGIPCIEKPFSIEKLLSVVQHNLKQD